MIESPASSDNDPHQPEKRSEKENVNPAPNLKRRLEKREMLSFGK